MVINPMFIKYTHEKWNMKHGRYPSTGMLAIIFALHLCDEVRPAPESMTRSITDQTHPTLLCV